MHKLLIYIHGIVSRLNMQSNDKIIFILIGISSQPSSIMVLTFSWISKVLLITLSFAMVTVVLLLSM